MTLFSQSSLYVDLDRLYSRRPAVRAYSVYVGSGAEEVERLGMRLTFPTQCPLFYFFLEPSFLFPVSCIPYHVSISDLSETEIRAYFPSQ